MDHLASLLAESTLKGVERGGADLVRASLHKLYELWAKLDLDAAQQVQRAKMVWTHVNNLLMEIVEEETASYKEICERIETYSVRVGNLSRALLVPEKEVSGSLIKREAVLRQELDELNALKEKRRQAYQNLKNTVMKFCKILDIREEKVAKSDPEVPTEEELQKMEKRVRSLREEKERRGKKLLELKKELTTILEQTELPPETLLEEDLLSGKDEELFLSCETVEALEQSVESARRRQEELESRKAALVERLSLLWSALRVDEEWKVNFLSRHLDVRPSTLRSIEEEVERCEELRNQDAERFSVALQKELEELWEECHVSIQQRALFRSGWAEHNLKRMEDEVRKWRQYRNEVAHVLKKIERRQQLMDQMAVFENKASDPSRFRNRKGHLLQEERERKKLQKEIPALEEDLFRDIRAYEEESGTPFLYYGGDFSVFAANQWTERRNQKESRRLERHKQDLLKMQSELTRLVAKRPNPSTPQSAPCKLLKPGSTPKAEPRTAPNTVDRLTTKSRRRGILTEANGPKTPDTTTYSKFADSLQRSVRDKLQSSVLSTKKRKGYRTPRRKTPPKKQACRSTRPKEAPVRGRFGLPFLL